MGWIHTKPVVALLAASCKHWLTSHFGGAVGLRFQRLTRMEVVASFGACKRGLLFEMSYKSFEISSTESVQPSFWGGWVCQEMLVSTLLVENRFSYDNSNFCLCGILKC